MWLPRAGVESIRLPGERGSNALEECRVAGVPLSADKWAEVVALADGTVPLSIERRPALFFLGHISPIFARFFAVFSLFSPS